MHIFSIFIILQGFFICFSFGSGLLGFLKTGFNFTVTKKSNTPILRRFNVITTSPTRPTISGVLSRDLQNITISADGKLPYSLHRLTRYVNHLKNEGSNILRFSHKMITDETKGRRNLMSIYPTTTSYAAKVHDYFELLKQVYKNVTIQRRSGKKEVFVSDGELLILNMLEKSCELLYRHQWQLINFTQGSSKKAYVDKIDFISKLINKQIDHWKKKEMHHICIYYEICLPYPAFTDHLEHLASELLKLPEKKLNTFTYSLKQLVTKNKDFLAIIKKIKGKPMTFQEIENISNKITLRESLTILRKVIHTKYRTSTGKPKNVRLQAVHVLLDIIDKAFQFNRDNNMDLEFDHFIAAIRRWYDNQRPFEVMLLEKLIDNILAKIVLIEHPAKVFLIEMLIRGESAQNNILTSNHNK